MTTYGPQNPTTATNTLISANDVTWTNPTNVFVDDVAYATCVPNQTFLTTRALDLTGFDFSLIPSGATIDGVTVDVDKKVSATGRRPRDKTVQLLIATVASGSNYAITGSNWPTVQAYSTYGGAADKWGLTPTESDAKNSGFGVRIRCETLISGVGQPTFSIDHVRMTIDGTAGGVAFVVSSSVFVRQAVRRASSY